MNISNSWETSLNIYAIALDKEYIDTHSFVPSGSYLTKEALADLYNRNTQENVTKGITRKRTIFNESFKYIKSGFFIRDNNVEKM